MRLRILCFVLLCVCVTVLPAHADTISLNVSSPFQVGSAFDVVVQVSDVFPTSDSLLFGFGFNVNYDSIFQYTGSTAGSLFDDLSGFPGGPTVAGLAKLDAPYFGAIGPLDFSGPLTLATLHFVALAPGKGSVGISGDPLSLNEGLIYFDLNTPNAAINASETIAAVPEPGSLILLLTGLPIVFLIGSRGRFH